MSKKKNNLVVLDIYKEEGGTFTMVLYKPYLYFIIKELFEDTTNVFDTSNWSTILDYAGVYDSHILMNYKALKPFVQDMYDENYLKKYITRIIKQLKRTEENYQESFYNNHQRITLQYLDNNSFDPTYLGSLSLLLFKKFIIYLMKNYNINKELAYTWYKKGLINKCFGFNISMLFNEDVRSVLLKLYKSEKEINKLEIDIFRNFIENNKDEINAG